MSTLRYDVDHALDAAVFEQGYTDLMGQSASEVSESLIAYDKLFEDYDVGDIEEYVQDYMDWYWREGRKQL